MVSCAIENDNTIIKFSEYLDFELLIAHNLFVIYKTIQLWESVHLLINIMINVAQGTDKFPLVFNQLLQSLQVQQQVAVTIDVRTGGEES